MMDQGVLDRVTTARARRRRRPAPRPAWSCENCATPNAGLRKRCTDCGTTRD
jgi:hypothetical protein